MCLSECVHLGGFWEIFELLLLLLLLFDRREILELCLISSGAVLFAERMPRRVINRSLLIHLLHFLRSHDASTYNKHTTYAHTYETARVVWYANARYIYFVFYKNQQNTPSTFSSSVGVQIQYSDALRGRGELGGRLKTPNTNVFWYGGGRKLKKSNCPILKFIQLRWTKIKGCEFFENPSEGGSEIASYKENTKKMFWKTWKRWTKIRDSQN